MSCCCRALGRRAADTAVGENTEASEQLDPERRAEQPRFKIASGGETRRTPPQDI